MKVVDVKGNPVGAILAQEGLALFKEVARVPREVGAVEGPGALQGRLVGWVDHPNQLLSTV